MAKRSIKSNKSISAAAAKRQRDALIVIDQIEPLILTIRDQKVLLDRDLAVLYGVPTKRLNEQVQRNRQRFPDDFMFRLTQPEWQGLRSQIATLKSGRGQHRKYLPYAFTEHGAIMAATILNSPAGGRGERFRRAGVREAARICSHA